MENVIPLNKIFFFQDSCTGAVSIFTNNKWMTVSHKMSVSSYICQQQQTPPPPHLPSPPSRYGYEAWRMGGRWLTFTLHWWQLSVLPFNLWSLSAHDIRLCHTEIIMKDRQPYKVCSLLPRAANRSLTTSLMSAGAFHIFVFEKTRVPHQLKAKGRWRLRRWRESRGSSTLQLLDSLAFTKSINCTYCALVATGGSLNTNQPQHYNR